MTSSAHGRPAVGLSDLTRYLDELLAAREIKDYGPNGLQVEGRPEVRKLVTGVSACLELFAESRARGADAVLVHHGLFWEGMPRTLVGLRYRRVAALIEAGLSLLAYHLPLDLHANLGNNAVGASAFGLVDLEPWGRFEGFDIGFRGRFPTPLSPTALVDLCRTVYGQEPLAFLDGPDEITSLALISGGASKALYAAIDEGLDAFVTGEPTEWVMNLAREAGIHYLAAGHYATERLGPRALGEHVAGKFGIEVEFVDVPNPV